MGERDPLFNLYEVAVLQIICDHDLQPDHKIQITTQITTQITIQINNGVHAGRLQGNVAPGCRRAFQSVITALMSRFGIGAAATIAGQA